MNVFPAYARAAKYFRAESGKIIISTLLIGLTTVAELSQAYPAAIMIEVVLLGHHPTDWYYRLFYRFAPAGKFQQIIALALSVLVLRFVQEGVGLGNGIFKIKIGFNGLLRVRSDLFRKLEELSLGFHRSRPQGDTIYRLGTDTNAFQAAFNVVQVIFVNLLKLLTLSAMMLGMNWQLGLIAIMIMPVLFWTIKGYGKVIQSTSATAARIESQLTTTIQRSVASIGLVQAFGREDDEIVRFDNNVRSSHNAWAAMHVHTLVYWLVMGMTFAVGLSVVLGYGGYLAFKGALVVGDLWVFLQFLTTQFYDPLYKLSGAGTDMRRYMAGMLRVYEILDTPPVIFDAPDAIDLLKQPRVLALDNVSFFYRPDSPVLRGVSAKIEPGEMVAFVGSSGVGKSSLLNLLPRFADPTGGAITLDGNDLRKIKLKSLRKHIALVLQENAILAATVAENIGYGRPDAPPEALRRAAELAGAAQFIDALPQKFQTVLDEGGQNLSGGQRQRIAIARALATEAPILVLDEPTSALDAQNERMITETLFALKGLRTIVLVSHRLSTVADCDRIYVMDAGLIIEQGTHEQLLAQRGAYYQMARHQLQLDDAPTAPTPA
jgi:ABC-type multidrug transport system fused ATPase/permease subunit